REHQRADESCPGRGISQVADMGGFVRIDSGVFDDSLFSSTGKRCDLASEPGEKKFRPVEKHVQIDVRRRIDARDPGYRLDRRRELLRNGARRLLQDARQLEG